MRGKILSRWFLFAFMLFSVGVSATEYVTPKPLVDVIKTPIQACGKTDNWNMDYITWGGDMVALYGNGNSKVTASGSLFAQAGLNIALTREDDVPKQVTAFLKCETPFLRGTVAMALFASDFADINPAVQLVPVVQVSWSNGADDVVYKPGVTSASDIETVAAQAYGPHTDWLVKTMLDAGKKPSDMKIKWTKDLVGLTGSTPGAAFREDKSVNAAFMIYPDAIALAPSQGAAGDDAYKGARIGFSTQTANHTIADVIYVRKDFYDAHKNEIAKFQNAYFKSAEELAKFMKDSKTASYKDGIKKMAMLLLDSDQPSSVADTEGMYSGANIVGWKGNVSFFADKNEPRNFAAVWNESQGALLQLGLLKKAHQPPAVAYDYNALKAGLTDTTGVEVPSIDVAKAKEALAKREVNGTLAQGEIFRPFGVGFQPNQTVFPEDQYAKDFDRAIDAIKTYGGALVTIEGHVDPYKYLKSKSKGATEVELGQIEQAGKNTSLIRASALRDALVKYATSRHIAVNPEAIQVIGHGIKYPVVANPATQADQMKNMRAEIRINIVESEEMIGQ